MKKSVVFFVFLCSVFVPLAEGFVGNTLFVEGTAPEPAMHNFFMSNFTMEASSLRLQVMAAREEADFTFSFDVQPNMILWADGSVTPAPPGEPQYALIITFTRNSDNAEIVAFSHIFDELDEMFEYNLFLLVRAVVLIPIGDGEGNGAGAAAFSEYGAWELSTFALRLSADFPVMLHSAGDGFWVEYSLPQLTVGFSALLLGWLVVEPRFQVGMGLLLRCPFYIRLSAGFAVGFPFIIGYNFALTPHLLASYTVSNIFLGDTEGYLDFPSLAFGGGVELGIRARRTDAVFIDVSFMWHMGDLRLPAEAASALNLEDGLLSRIVFTVGIGYRFGLRNRTGALFPRGGQ